MIEELSNIVAENARSATHTVFSDISSHQELSIGSFKTKQDIQQGVHLPL